MIKILHLGLGRFHRAHQAVYYQRLKEQGVHHLNVVSMSMRSNEARDDLRSVDHKFPVIEFGQTPKIIWVDCIREAHSCQDELERVLDCFLLPHLELVTLTITEKGYDLNAEGRLDLGKVRADLANPERPHSAIGLLALGLRLRREKGLSALTIMSCDNLRENSHKLKAALSDYTEALHWDKDLLWIKNDLAFPNSMVDRIVPALKDEKIEHLEQRFNLPKNSQLIATEEFSQWVIEDKFVHRKPALDLVGVQFVNDVRPYEEMKLRLLNAAHSFLAYAGLNRGHQYVHEAIGDKELHSAVQSLFSEVIPLLHIPIGFDAHDYGNKLIARFRNSELPHQLRQIAMDGSQKMPLRIFPSFREAYRSHRLHKTLLRAIHEWMRFCQKSESLDDPMSSKILAALKGDVKNFFELDPMSGFNQEEKNLLESQFHNLTR